MAEASPAGGTGTPPTDWAVTDWGFAPLVGRTPGFEAYYLIDAGAGVIVSISLFADRAGAEASTRKTGEWVRGHLADLVQGRRRCSRVRWWVPRLSSRRRAPDTAAAWRWASGRPPKRRVLPSPEQVGRL
jgi:hypothetical protein